MAAAQRTTSYQREVAERNVEAILDAAEELLQSQGQVNISAIAAQAGVSRVTVYAHFPTSTALLEAAVERAVRRTTTALESVHADDGPPVEALDRMVASCSSRTAPSSTCSGQRPAREPGRSAGVALPAQEVALMAAAAASRPDSHRRPRHPGTLGRTSTLPRLP
jgi:AcrR family transcriptional regulator